MHKVIFMITLFSQISYAEIARAIVNGRSNIVIPNNACSKDPIRGPCRALLRRYFYNPVVNECKEFQYSGCGGNENNFKTKSLCESACKPANAITNDQKPIDCKLSIDPGPCRGRFPRWAFNGIGCEQFEYGGCGGNWNRFESFDECRSTCSSAPDQSIIDQSDRFTTGASLDHVCTWPLMYGPCKSYFSNWGFRNGRCEEFVYGGCGGNANRFRTKDECEKQCVQPSLTVLDNWSLNGQQNKLDQCNSPVDTGPCRGYFQRWAYDGGKCVQFIYGGCEGNANNFDTRNQCEQICVRNSEGVRKECPQLPIAAPPVGCEMRTWTKSDGCPRYEISCTEGACAFNPCRDKCESCVNEPCKSGSHCIGYRCETKEDCSSISTQINVSNRP